MAIYDIQPIVDKQFETLKALVGTTKPHLAIVKTSDDYASEKYINNKLKLAEKLNIKAEVVGVEALGYSDAHGIIVQLPVGSGYDEKRLVQAVPKEKDVDGFHLEHLGELVMTGNTRFAPCTAMGALDVLNAYFENKLDGKKIVIINRSNIVGKPLALMLIARNATVTICHSKTKEEDLRDYIKGADAVVTAVGKPNFITRDMLKEGAVVVDVAICRNEEGKICGDVAQDVKDADDVWTTPVPKGIGQLTVINLMANTVKASYGC